MKTKSMIKVVVGVVIGLFVLITGLNCCSTVGPTERGVKVTMGKPGTEVLMPGLNFKAPYFQTIQKYDITPVEYEKSFSCGSDGAISKDMQTIGLTFTLYWKYDESRICEVANKYKTQDSIYQPVSTSVKAALKDQIGHYSVEELIANQSKITTDVRSEFTDELAYLPIVITDFKIGNFDWSDDYDAMIKKTMTRKQEVEQMKQEVALTEQQAQKQVKQAEADKQKAELDAEANLLKAQKEAEAAKAKAEGEAAAKKALADAELYEAQQIAKAGEMKRAQWAHEEKMAELEAWNGKKVSDVMVMTPSGTLTTVNGK